MAKTRPRQPVADPEAVQRAISAASSGPRARWWRRRGIKRRGFWYQDASGARITDEDSLARIRSLVLPPGWLEVRVNPKAGGRIQAVGVDALGRLQYRYHPRFVSKRQELKYSRLERFGERLPVLRERTNRDLCVAGYSRERILAAVVRLMNDLYIRLGCDASAARYRTYGATTLRNRHVRVSPDGRLEFDYVGKHHIRHRRVMIDGELCALLSELKSIGGSRLFNYLDDSGKPHPLRPADVNRYIKEAIGEEFSSKDFRTWHGTLLAAEALAEMGPPADQKQAKKALVTAVKRVAEQLGNTPAVCRSSYVHPAVLECYQKGVTLDAFRRSGRRVVRMREAGHEPAELALLEMLKSSR